MHRTWGGLVAGGLFVLPSLFILIALSWIYMAHGNLPVVAGLFYGIKPAVTALVAHAAWRIGSRTLKNGWLWSIAVAAFIAIFALQVPFPLIVLVAGVVGFLGGRFAPQRFTAGGAHAAEPQGRMAPPSSTMRHRYPSTPASAGAASAVILVVFLGVVGRRARPAGIDRRQPMRCSRRWPGSSPRPRC